MCSAQVPNALEQLHQCMCLFLIARWLLDAKHFQAIAIMSFTVYVILRLQSCPHVPLVEAQFEIDNLCKGGVFK